jgi:DNA-binding protein YbaB
MLVVAINSAIEQSQAMSAQRMEGITGGLGGGLEGLLGGLPGF